MDQVTKVRTYLKREQWKSLISECQSSGIIEQTYYKNLKKLREEICESLPATLDLSAKPTVFKKLEVQSPISGTQAAVIIHLPNASLEIQNGATRQTVEAVLLALKSIC